MSIAAALSYQVLSQPLAAAEVGKIFDLQTGYLHVARFVNADGTENLSGLVECSLSYGEDDWLPLGPNADISLTTPRDRIRLRWAAQAGVTAILVIAKDPTAFQVANPPARLFVSTAGGTTIATGVVAVGTGATLIRAANSSRQSLTVQNDGGADVFIGAAAVALATGLRLTPGAIMAIDKTTAAIYGIVAAGSINVRYLEES